MFYCKISKHKLPSKSHRKTVGNFIAGNDTSSDKSSQQSSGGASSSGASGGYDEKNAPHTKLPVDTYYYPGTRYWYYLMDVEVTRVGHCKYCLTVIKTFFEAKPLTLYFISL